MVDCNQRCDAMRRSVLEFLQMLVLGGWRKRIFPLIFQAAKQKEAQEEATKRAAELERKLREEAAFSDNFF